MNSVSVFASATITDVLRAANLAQPADPRKLVRCPLPGHDDASPSFRVFDRGFLCFGCGRKGGVADLVIALGFACNRRSAASWLEDRVL